jgi:hypothetical protein
MLAVLLTTFVSAQDVQYNFDQQADFLRFQTYKWIDTSGSLQLDDLLAKDIQQAFDATLAKRGLTRVEGDPADLYLRYQVAVNREKELTTSGWSYGPGWRRSGGMTTASTTTILVGSVALDMYDVSSKQLVWRGVVTRTIDPNARPETRRKNLAKAFEKLLKNYPPGKRS